MQAEKYWWMQKNVRYHEFLLQQLKNHQGREKNSRKVSVTWSHATWKETVKHALKDTTLTDEQRDKAAYTKTQVLAWMITTSRRRHLNQLENCQKVCSQIVLQCLYLARIGGSDIIWSVHRTCSKQSQNVDKSLWQNARLVWFRTFTTRVITDNIVMWETRLSIVGWVYSKTQILLATLRTKNQPREVFAVYLRKFEHSSPLVGRARNKTSEIHNSTESEIISLDAGFRVDRLFALDLWVVMIESVHVHRRVPNH